MAFIEVSVGPTRLQKLLMAALLDNTTSLDDDDAIRRTDGGEPMGNHDGDSPGKGRLDPFLDLMFSMGVYR